MSIQDMASNQKTKDDQNLREGVAQFYKNKYPGKIDKPAEGETVKPMTAEERQAADREFSAGIFKANQAANADMLSKLQAVFAGKNAKGVK